MQCLQVYVTQWNQIIDDYGDGTQFRAWGRTSSGERVCIHVSGFTPFLYIEPNIGIQSTLQYILKEHARLPTAITPVRLPKLYYANVTPEGERVTYDMARCHFSTNIDFRYIANVFERKRVPVNPPRTYLVHEFNVAPLLQYLCQQKLMTVGWHEFTGFARSLDARDTLADIELDCLATSCTRCTTDMPAPPLSIWSFDIETYSSVHNRMPIATNPDDTIIQISLVADSESHLLHIGPPLVIPGTTVHSFTTESDMLVGFAAHIHKLRPDLLLGYNILGFDFKYIIERCQLLRCFKALQLCGLHKYNRADVQQIKWSSSAFRNQEFVFVPLEGIVIVDLLPIIRRDYSCNSYRLDSVAKQFLGSTEGKDDVSPAFMFAAWKSQSAAQLTAVGAYCVHDSVLVLRLFDTLQILTIMTEMAILSYINMFDIYARGQQLRVFSQIYQFCFQRIVVDRDHISREDGYAGARVFDPEPGIYENVVSFDFNSLYPTTIIASNICFSTCALDDAPHITDDQCYVLEWEDHVGCAHDTKLCRKKYLATLPAGEKSALRREREELAKYKPAQIICATRRFRFVKTLEGVVPTIIKHLLAKRKETKTAMKQFRPGTLEYTVLNARQTAFKLSANSMYGFFGVTRGYLPFMPAAMSITYLGRQNVLKAAQLITTVYGGHLIYGDTDSVYATFARITSIAELWD